MEVTALRRTDPPIDAGHDGRERVLVWCGPDERSIPPLAERYGDRFLWASDFPHADHTPDYIPALAEMAAGFPEPSPAGLPG
jgi:hypothetical protein